MSVTVASLLSQRSVKAYFEHWHILGLCMQGKARLFRAGSPLVYGGAVERIAGGTPHTADCVVVHDHNLEHIGWGFFCPASMYRVR